MRKGGEKDEGKKMALARKCTVNLGGSISGADGAARKGSGSAGLVTHRWPGRAGDEGRQRPMDPINGASLDGSHWRLQARALPAAARPLYLPACPYLPRHI